MENKRLRILFLSRFQNKVNRGVETFVFELTERLSRNYDVEILSEEKADSFKEIMSGNFDVVIPTNGRLQSLKSNFGRIFNRYKIIISGHAGMGKDDIWNIFITRPDLYVALTEAEEKWAKKWAFGVKIVKIPNGIDLDRFKPEGETLKIDLKGPIILSVGALNWYKHHELTIEAVSRLSKGTLLIIGKGEEEMKLRKIADEKIPGRFQIISAKYDDMPSIYRAADLFVLPSWDREAFGIVYLEAMASGLPVVAPNDLSRREIIGDAGILVDVTDSKKYSEAIQQSLSKKWGDMPRKQAEKFSWDRIAKQYEDIIKELCK